MLTAIIVEDMIDALQLLKSDRSGKSLTKKATRYSLFRYYAWRWYWF